MDATVTRDLITNTKIEKNYLFNVGSIERTTGAAYVAVNSQYDRSEQNSLGNSFCDNRIKESQDIPHLAVTIRPDGGNRHRYMSFENEECSDDTTKCKVKDYYYPAEWDIEIPDMEPWLKVNSCEKGNTSKVSSEEFVPTRNIIKHIDKSGNTLSPNDAIIVNGGENFIAAPRKNLVGVSGDNIYTKEYSVRLYDENNNLITTDINGNRISDENGYINNYTEISLNSLLKNNQTLKFVYAYPDELPESEEILIPKVPDAGRVY